MLVIKIIVKTKSIYFSCKNNIYLLRLRYFKIYLFKKYLF